MAFLGLILPIIAGWLGWTKWLAIPLGLLIFVGIYRADPQGAAKVAPFAFITGPLIALVLMWVGGFAQGLISN